MPVAQVHRSDIAVCGRRDVSLSRSIQKRRQKNPRLTWYLKDEVMRRGRVYYAKLAGGRSMFVALGETARASGLSRVEAGSGSHQLVDDGYAIRLRQGVYALASSKNG
jgi:hypothetical protein